MTGTRRPKNWLARTDHRDDLFALFDDSPDFRALHAYVGPLLKAPRSLSGLRDILIALEEILPHVAPGNPRIDNEIGLVTDWVNLLARSDRGHSLWKCEVIATYIERPQPDGTVALKPHFQGIHDSHPVWCALFFRSSTPERHPEAEERHDTFRRLQAWYLGAFIRIKVQRQIDSQTAATKAHGKQLREDVETLTSRLREAGRLLRTIHEPEFVTEIDHFAAITTERGAHAKLAIRHEYATATLRQGYGAFADLLNQGYSLNQGSVFRGRAAQTGRHSGQGRGPRREYDLLREDHHHYAFILSQGAPLATQDWPRAVVDVFGPGESLADELYNGGISPDEYDDEVAARVSLSDLDKRAAENPADLPPLRSLYAAANARARAILVDAQRLTTRLERITVADLALLMGELEAAYAAASAPVEDATAAPVIEAARICETARLLAASLVTGTKPEFLRRLPEVNSFADLPGDWHISFARGDGEDVWLRPYRRPDRSPLKEIHKPEAIETWPHVALRDTWGVGATLGATTQGTWFQHTTEYYRETFTKTFAPALARAGVTERWQRFDAIAEIIPSWFLGHEEGNQLRIAVLFDRDDRYANTQHYYTVLDRARLATSYEDGMNDLWTRVRAAGFTGRGSLFSRQTYPDQIAQSWVGDDRVPKVPALKEIARALTLQVDQLQETNGANSIEYHNALATHTAFMLAVVTGCRAVRTPIPDLGLIDQETGFLPLHEKDTKDRSHARIVWIPPAVRALIRRYLRHVNAFLTTRSGTLKTMTLTVAATKARDRSRFDSRSYELWLPRTIFFIDTKGRVPRYVEWTGSTLQSHINRVAPGRWYIENAGRHFLRSFLDHRGCAPTVISAHFGHWQYGERPWMQESTFDPYRYRDEIASHLEELVGALEQRS
jgi:hypothetical protein